MRQPIPQWLLRVGLAASAALALLPAAARAATSNDQTSFTVTAGSLGFYTGTPGAPAMPTLTGVTLNGTAQTTNTTMTNFGVQDATGTGSGWNVTVQGQTGTGNSPVFAEYCNSASACGGTSAFSYVSPTVSLPAGSLTLNSTGASFAAVGSTTGTAPTLVCSAGCAVDSATAVKVASAATSAGMGTFGTTGFTATSLALATPSSLKVPATNEVYRVNLIWTLTAGP